MDILHDPRRRWGSFLDMPEHIARQASAILRRARIPPNITFLLPYVSTETGERRVWRFGAGAPPVRRGSLRDRVRGTGTAARPSSSACVGPHVDLNGDPWPDAGAGPGGVA